MFTPRKPNLDPDELMAAQVAFDLASATVASLPHDLDERTARALIARRIMRNAVEHGERDAVRLKAYALRGFKP